MRLATSKKVPTALLSNFAFLIQGSPHPTLSAGKSERLKTEDIIDLWSPLVYTIASTGCKIVFAHLLPFFLRLIYLEL